MMPLVNICNLFISNRLEKESQQLISSLERGNQSDVGHLKAQDQDKKGLGFVPKNYFSGSVMALQGASGAASAATSVTAAESAGAASEAGATLVVAPERASVLPVKTA